MLNIECSLYAVQNLQKKIDLGQARPPRVLNPTKSYRYWINLAGNRLI